MKRYYSVAVFSEGTEISTRYEIRADSADDARIIAFVLDGGFTGSHCVIDDGEFALVLMYTKIISVIDA